MTGIFSFRRARAIARKEIFHILRDPFTLALALGLPVILVVIFGFAIEFNIRNIRVAAVDADHSPASRAVIDAFSASGYFEIVPRAFPARALLDLDQENAKATLLINKGFNRELGAGRPAEAQILLDGADNSTVGVILGYLAGVRTHALRRIVEAPPAEPVSVRTRYLFNPELNSRWFVVPGLLVVVIAVLSVLLTAVTVAREWENGSMELLLSTPVRPMEIVLGKLAPYTILGLSSVAFVYLIARVAFGIPFVGSHLLLLAGSLLFLAACLAQGLLISVLTRKQQIAMQFGIVSGLLPSLLLSGFIFPIESMPRFFQYLTSILPAKWFMMITRGVFLRGSGPVDLAQPFLGLLLLNGLLISVAARRFKKDLEP